MKKITLLAAALFAFTAQAQFTIDFDDMTPGDVSPQSEHIVLWPAAGVTDATVTSDQSNSGSQSIFFEGNMTDDILVQLGNQTSGVWTVSFWLFVDGESNAFWNIQDNEEADPAQWNGQFFAGVAEDIEFSEEGKITFDQALENADFLYNFWTQIEMVFDLDNGTLSMDVDGMPMLEEVPYATIVEGALEPATQLGSINFYSIDANSSFYVDDFVLDGELSTEDFNADVFSVYPNPVKDILNIKSQETVSNVNVYNVLGKQVYTDAPNAASPTVDMSGFSSGVYFVEVTIGDATKTVKVLK